MDTIKINEQIAFLRKQKGLTQEELAKALGVTNQAVSKWELAACCPDIQLLPAIAELFDVTIDELMGYKPADGLGDICLKIRSYFKELKEKEAFEKAYRIASLLHEVAVTDGYKKEFPWEENRDYSTEAVRSWGLSVCSEPEGSTGRISDGIFFSLGKEYASPSAMQLKTLLLWLEQLNDLQVLKTMYALYELTIHDFDLYVSCEEVAKEAHLTVEEAEAALKKLPVTVKEENGRFLYRLEGSHCHIPPLLKFFVD